MTPYLLTDGFKWLRKEEIDKSGINTISKDYEMRCTLEVDLEYLRNLFSLHDDYPLSQEQIQVDENTLLDYCKKILKPPHNLIREVKNFTPNTGHKQKHNLQYKIRVVPNTWNEADKNPPSVKT